MSGKNGLSVKDSDPYGWQSNIYKNWSNVGFCGVLEAKPSAGKTRGACIALRSYVDVFGPSKILIVAPNNTILNQWEPYILEYELDAEYSTYLTAVKEMSRGNIPDVLILDECHSCLAPEWGKVLNYGVPHVMGLSGTPGESYRRVGPIFMSIGWDEINIAPTTIHYITFTPTDEELEKYNYWSDRADAYKKEHPNANIKNDIYLANIYFRRRGAAHRMPSRLPIALALIKHHLGERMMVFCELTKQVKDLSKLLTKYKIDHCVHITGKQELDKFRDGEKDIILSVKMVSEGFSDTNITCGIVVSSATSEKSHVQEIGRIIRPKEGKKANIYALVANGTTDDRMIKNNDFTKKDKVILEWKEWKTYIEAQTQYNQ